MKIRQDVLKITTGKVNLAGEKVEPELQTVVREITTSADVSTASGPALGQMKSSIVVETPAHEVARALSHPCSTCKHFDHRACREFFGKADAPDAPIALREAANEIRAALLMTHNADVHSIHEGQDGEMDVEHALKSIGFCQALSDVMKEPIIVHPLSTCPQEIRTAAQPNGLWKAKNRAAEKSGQLAYDAVMQLAAGKKGGVGL